MKRVIEETSLTGLESLIGEEVILFCGNYFYAGQLVGVGKTVVALKNSRIVFETGDFSDKQWKDAQSLGDGETYVRIQWIEAFRKGK